MVIFLDVLATRFPMDLQSDMAFISKNIAVYVVQISQIELDGKMCYVTTGKDSKLKDIDCLPCVYNKSCKNQMVCIQAHTHTVIYFFLMVNFAKTTIKQPFCFNCNYKTIKQHNL